MKKFTLPILLVTAMAVSFPVPATTKGENLEQRKARHEEMRAKREACREDSAMCPTRHQYPSDD